jgi:F0F1-type ATP synthase membrane subunit b/b'
VNASIEEVIKGIVDIDKSAVQQREALEKEVNQKRKEAEQHIQRLKSEIVESQKEKVKAMRKEEINRTSIEAENIKQSAYKKCEDMYKNFKQHKDSIVKEIFEAIFKE